MSRACKLLLLATNTALHQWTSHDLKSNCCLPRFWIHMERCQTRAIFIRNDGGNTRTPADRCFAQARREPCSQLPIFLCELSIGEHSGDDVIPRCSKPMPQAQGSSELAESKQVNAQEPKPFEPDRSGKSSEGITSRQRSCLNGGVSCYPALKLPMRQNQPDVLLSPQPGEVCLA